MALKSYFNKVTKIISPRLPTILTGIGLAIEGAAIVSAAKSTPKYMKLEEERKEIGDNSRKAKAKNVVKAYGPSIGLYVAGGVAIGSSDYLSLKKQAALSAAALTATETLRTYKGYVAKELGEKGFSELQDKVAQDVINDNPVSDDNVVISSEIDPNSDVYPCYDEWSGRYFLSNEDKIRRVCAEISADMLVENWVSLNEYYSKPEIGLPNTEAGEALGWNVSNDAFMDHSIEPVFSSGSMPDGKPCKVVNFLVPPTTNYKWEY